MVLRRSAQRRPFLRRRRDDAGAASMISYIIGAAVFVLGTSVLVNFIVEPPGAPASSLEQQDLKAKASGTLDVLMGTSGYPPAWDGEGPDDVARLGLVEQGTTVRLDPAKFAALARGRFYSPSDTNGVVDYAEAKDALGLDGYDFHIRAAPLIPDDPTGLYGTQGMTDYRVAYIRNQVAGVPDESGEATAERKALKDLDIGFDDEIRLNLATDGDVFNDDSALLKAALVPLLGTGVSQVAIASGSGQAYDFQRVNATDFDHLVSVGQSGMALALARTDSQGDVGLAYTKGREIRATLASANLTDQATATISWKEHVNTNGTGATNDDGDYGFVEVSPDGGATWIQLTNAPDTRSQDSTLHPQSNGVWTSQAVVLSAANCAACLDNEEVLIAFHWVADGDNNVGHGWIVDEIQVSINPGISPITLLKKTFEKPEYDLVIIGTGADQMALTPNEVKDAIRDYVETYGGRIVVLGGETNAQWLQPLFHVGSTTSSHGVSNPDPTHPLLNTPNPLDWQGFGEPTRAWEFSGGSDADLFDMVLGDGDDQHVLSVSTSAAFGAAGGGVILTGYEPGDLAEAQGKSFLANCIAYGKYHHLYMEMGPAVPTDVPVASASRTAVMQKTLDGDEYGEIGFVLYLWRGNVSTVATDSTVPTAPRFFTLGLQDDDVEVAWSPPSYVGSSAIQGYHVYRGTLPGYVSLVKDVTNPNTVSWTDTGRSYGVTYYYRVAAYNGQGEGENTTEKSVTPATTPTAPQSLSAAGGAGQFLVTWTDPASSGGAAITGYRIHRGASSNFQASESNLLAEIGANNSFTDIQVGSDDTKYYRVVAVNGMGQSPASNSAGGTTYSVPATPAMPIVTTGISSITITWTPPSSATAITSYRIYAGNTAQETSLLTTVDDEIHTFTEEGLASGQTRYYRVAGVNSAGEGGISPAVSGTTLRLSTAPTLVMATGGPDTITLTWGPPTDPGSSTPTHYRVYRGTTSGSLTWLADTVDGNNVSFDDTGLPDAATRYYKVSAVTSAGEGAHSSEVVATTHNLPSAATLTATPDVERIVLAWTPPANAGGTGAVITSYKIYRGTAAGAETYLDTTTVAPQETYTYSDPRLDSSVTYYYYVRAVTAAGEGTPSNEANATPLPRIGI